DANRALDLRSYSYINGRSCKRMRNLRDPSLRNISDGNIYVKSLYNGIDNKSYGNSFVHYETEDAAKRAIQRANGMKIGNFEKPSDRIRRGALPDTQPDPISLAIL
ncbi:unnamed protein product, partial [Prorocentrum cordatum]